MNKMLVKHTIEKTNMRNFFNDILNKRVESFIIIRDADCVYSFTGKIEYNNNTLKITDICIQIESMEGGFHDVCRSNDDYALVSLDDYTLIKDCFLEDKYDDGFDNNLTNLLGCFFI